LLAIEVVEALRTMRQGAQRDLLQRFRAIAEFPSVHSDYSETDATGRRIEVHIFRKFAIKYWDDFADRHIKIIDLKPADRTGR
jgi:hypothetical protein